MALDVLCTRVNVIRAREKWLKIPRWVELSFGTVSNLQERRHGVPEERVYRTCLLIHLASQTDSVYFLSNFRFPCLSFARWRSINILRVVDTDCLTEIEDLGGKMADQKSWSLFHFDFYLLSHFRVSIRVDQNFYFLVISNIVFLF